MTTEGRPGDAPPAGLWKGVGELTGTALGVAEGVGYAGEPGVTGVEVVPGAVPVGEVEVNPVGAGVAGGDGGVTMGVSAVGAGVVPGVPAVEEGLLPGAALVGAGVAAGRVTVGVPGVGAGVLPGLPAVGEGTAAGVGGMPLTVDAGEEPNVGAGVVPGVCDVGAGVATGLWTGVGELPGAAAGVPGVGETDVLGSLGDGLAGLVAGLSKLLIGVKVNVAGVGLGVLLGAGTGASGEAGEGDPDCTGGEGVALEGLGDGRGGAPTEPGLRLVWGLAGVVDLPGVALGVGKPAGEVGTDAATGVGLVPAGVDAGVCPGAGGKGMVGVGTSATWLLGDCDARGAVDTGLLGTGVGEDLGAFGGVLGGVCVAVGDPDAPGLMGVVGMLGAAGETLGHLQKTRTEHADSLSNAPMAVLRNMQSK